MNVLVLITTLLGAVPQIISLVTAIEQAATGSGQTGPDKLATVLAIVLSGLETTVPNILSAIGLTKVSTFITNVVNTVVGFLNKIGVFTHSTPASPAGS